MGRAAVKPGKTSCKNVALTLHLLTFHLHVLRLAELLLAGFLLLRVVVVHVGCGGDGGDALFPACFRVALDLVQARLDGGAPGSGLRVRCVEVRRWGDGRQVEPRRPGLLCDDLGLVRCQRRGVGRKGLLGSGQRNADVFARYSPNLGALGGGESLADDGTEGSEHGSPKRAKKNHPGKRGGN